MSIYLYISNTINASLFYLKFNSHTINYEYELVKQKKIKH